MASFFLGKILFNFRDRFCATLLSGLFIVLGCSSCSLNHDSSPITLIHNDETESSLLNKINNIKRPTSMKYRAYFDGDKTLVFDFFFDFSYDFFGIKKVINKEDILVPELFRFDYISLGEKTLLMLQRKQENGTSLKYYFDYSPRGYVDKIEVYSYEIGTQDNSTTHLTYDADDKLTSFITKGVAGYVNDTGLSYNGDEISEKKEEYDSDLFHRVTEIKYDYHDTILNPFYGLFFGAINSGDLLSAFFPLELKYQKNMMSSQFIKQNDEIYGLSSVIIDYEYVKTEGPYPIHYKAYETNVTTKKRTLIHELFLSYD